MKCSQYFDKLFSLHVSLQERAVLASLMIASWLAIPAWVLLHMDEYKGK